jgi:hypothetical protein
VAEDLLAELAEFNPGAQVDSRALLGLQTAQSELWSHFSSSVAWKATLSAVGVRARVTSTEEALVAFFSRQQERNLHRFTAQVREVRRRWLSLLTLALPEESVTGLEARHAALVARHLGREAAKQRAQERSPYRVMVEADAAVTAEVQAARVAHWTVLFELLEAYTVRREVMAERDRAGLAILQGRRSGLLPAEAEAARRAVGRFAAEAAEEERLRAAFGSEAQALGQRLLFEVRRDAAQAQADQAQAASGVALDRLWKEAGPPALRALTERVEELDRQIATLTEREAATAETERQVTRRKRRRMLRAVMVTRESTL